ncbi:uncharacterized protein LOC119613503 [Lucilia sericata]|uniref:uncharacterized protein LOC119613503 n=1 Tax=Lucilia sericata TaxID=13632 RepID=UPI0018A861B5|nr:uncharacterized protein LOC119613503 [Lucilia sericata]
MGGTNGKYAKYIYLILIVLIQLTLLTVAKIKCIQCGGKKEICSTELEEEPKDCPDNHHTKCFTQIDTSGNIERGCKTDDEAQNCKAENNCIITDEEKNNQFICKKCDATDEKCSQTDMNINDLKYNQICEEGIKKCLKKVEEKLVVRDCATETDIIKCTDANVCEICDSINCNSGIYPKKRIICYQCTGSSCLDVTADNIVYKACTNYEEDDRCYTIAKSETDMIRGCKSDTKDNPCSDAAVGCAYCTSDNCNNLKYKYEQKLRCHQCTSDDQENECFKTQTSQVFEECENELFYNESEYCYLHMNDSTIERGCLQDQPLLTVDNCHDDENYICYKCNHTNGCNSKEKYP